MIVHIAKNKPRMNTDLLHGADIVFVRLYLHMAPCKNHGASPQIAQSSQRGGGAGVGEDKSVYANAYN